MGVEYRVRLKSLEDYVTRAHGSFRQLDVPEIRVIQRGVRAMVLAVAEEWPVDTGLSRDAWRGYTSLSARPFEVVIENEVFYAQYVHPRGTSPDDVLWEDLVPAVVAELMPSILAQARAEIDRTEARIRAGRGTVTRGLTSPTAARVPA